jgi:SAM-dependent methyltransferase
MSEHSRPYAIHSDEECERLELQARLANIHGHLKYLPIAANDRVLEVGCGSGSMSRLIARSFPQADVVAVDMRRQYLHFAAAKARTEAVPNVAFGQGDVFALPFADASFDVVWTKYLLQWVKDQKRALAELKRVTRPGGWVVSCDVVGVAVDHFPISHAFDRQVRGVMGAMADCEVGRKIAPYMLALGFLDVRVDIETDTIYTIIGGIDRQRRWNSATMFHAARAQITQSLGSESAAEEFIERLLAVYDDPMTCSFCSLYFTRGRVGDA